MADFSCCSFIDSIFGHKPASHRSENVEVTLLNIYIQIPRNIMCLQLAHRSPKYESAYIEIYLKGWYIKAVVFCS